VGELGEALGLTNAWTGEVDEVYGLGQTDIEGMTDVGDASVFHTSTDDPEGEDVIAALEQNPVWGTLPAVVDDRVFPFPAGIWTFGGPRSSQQVVDAYVGVLTG
jgi:ferric hydroxamate transport system substrate-binding protein